MEFNMDIAARDLKRRFPSSEGNPIFPENSSTFWTMWLISNSLLATRLW